MHINFSPTRPSCFSKLCVRFCEPELWRHLRQSVSNESSWCSKSCYHVNDTTIQTYPTVPHLIFGTVHGHYGRWLYFFFFGKIGDDCIVAWWLYFECHEDSFDTLALRWHHNTGSETWRSNWKRTHAGKTEILMVDIHFLDAQAPERMSLPIKFTRRRQWTMFSFTKRLDILTIKA